MKKVLSFSNAGVYVYFILNVISVIFILSFFMEITFINTVYIVMIYIGSVAIGLSPIGEWGIALMVGAKEIHRKDMMIRLVPLLELAYEKAKHTNPELKYNIKLKIIDSAEVNAIAIGKSTICVTRGILSMTDDDILGLFAHELGHIANGHTITQLLVGGSNFFVSAILWIIKFISWSITIVIGILSIGARQIRNKILIAIVAAIPIVAYGIWYKICMVFFMWSMRQNEYIADKFAYEIGLGNELAQVLDKLYNYSTHKKYYVRLLSTHPNTDERIARLQHYGATYSRY